jgi:hypothetical protein
MQYLVTMEYVDPGPLLAPQEFLGMCRTAVLPGHEAIINLTCLAADWVLGEVHDSPVDLIVYHPMRVTPGPSSNTS